MIELLTVAGASVAAGWVTAKLVKTLIGVIKTVAALIFGLLLVLWFLGIISIHWDVLVNYILLITQFALGKADEIAQTITLSTTTISFAAGFILGLSGVSGGSKEFNIDSYKSKYID